MLMQNYQDPKSYPLAVSQIHHHAIFALVMSQVSGSFSCMSSSTTDSSVFYMRLVLNMFELSVYPGNGLLSEQAAYSPPRVEKVSEFALGLLQTLTDPARG